MSLEEQLRMTLGSAEEHDAGFDRQLQDFRRFEEQMAAGGYQIEREKFSIPLMDRVSASYLYS